VYCNLSGGLDILPDLVTYSPSPGEGVTFCSAGASSAIDVSSSSSAESLSSSFI
jgi:hypothetical protein